MQRGCKEFKKLNKAKGNEPPARVDEDLVDVTVRLSRRTVARAILNARADERAASEQRLAVAKTILDNRRRRRSLFPGVRLGEASWDMMLDLYIADATGRLVDISGLCIASGTPTTTALRHIETLVEQGYVIREDDANDGRRTFIHSEEKLRAAVDSWLDMYTGAIVEDRL